MTSYDGESEKETVKPLAKPKRLVSKENFKRLTSIKMDDFKHISGYLNQQKNPKNEPREKEAGIREIASSKNFKMISRVFNLKDKAAFKRLSLMSQLTKNFISIKTIDESISENSFIAEKSVHLLSNKQMAMEGLK
jgi:hypothetical protein